MSRRVQAGRWRLGRGVRWRPLAAAWGLWLALLAPAHAATWEGLDVTIDTDWPGCGYGGYFPIRITVNNRGQPRSLKFTLSSTYGPMPTVTRSLEVQTERVAFSLLAPCVNSESYGTLTVMVDGQVRSALTHSVSLPDSRGFDSQGPAVLLVETRDGDWTEFQAGVESLVAGTPPPSSGVSYYGYSPTISAADDHKYLPPEQLPSEWQAYSGLDLVVIPQPLLARLDNARRNALLAWVDCGGNLLVSSLTGGPGSLDPLLGITAGVPGRPAWSKQDFADSVVQVRPRMQGLVVASEGNPLADFDSNDWSSFLTLLTRDRWDWTSRHGFSARYPTEDFLQFLIPSVQGVPVVAFLVLITLFAVAIGPVNYLYLWKQGRLYLLVVTIPAIALVTSLSLFGYSMLAHGFATRSRVRSLTVLDQSRNTAVEMSRVSYYSGLAPAGGLLFQRETAVYPMWPAEFGFESGLVDWTDRQHFASGWLRSRTRTQFFVTTHRDRRGRLDVKPEGDSTLNVANGLEWTLSALVVADDQGRLFYGEGLAAGDAQRLTPLTAEQSSEMIRRLGQYPLQAPADAPAGGGWSSYPRFPYGQSAPNATYATNLAELKLRELIHPSAWEAGPDWARRYVALLERNPGLDLGLPRAQEEASLHVLIGSY